MERTPRAAAPDNQPPQQQPASISPQQMLEALAAVTEVLNGAPTSRVLELADKIVIGRLVLGAVLRGELAIGQPGRPQQNPRKKVA